MTLPRAALADMPARATSPRSSFASSVPRPCYPSYSYGLAFIAKSQLYGCLTRKTYPAGGATYLQLVSASPCFQQQLELAACGCSTGQSELCMMASPCTCWVALLGKLCLRIDAKKCEPHALDVGIGLRALLLDVPGDVGHGAEIDLIVTALLQAGRRRLERVVARGENRAVELRRYKVEVALRKPTGPTLLGVGLCAVEVGDCELVLLDQIRARGQERGVANRRGPGSQHKAMLGNQLHKLGRERV
eukprot:scaffold71007_cov71-Phaeocystis_antarctica.AAC.5